VFQPGKSCRPNKTSVSSERREFDFDFVAEGAEYAAAGFCPHAGQKFLSQGMTRPAECHGSAKDHSIWIDGVNHIDNSNPQIPGRLKDDLASQAIPLFGRLGND
jgi:hypothetical protein